METRKAFFPHAGASLPVERRSVFLERCGAMLKMRWQIQRFM
jgi:hypothetical protein